MLIGFACVAVVLGSLARPTEAAQLTARAAWYLTLFAAPVGIVYRSGATRAFWVGVAAFGWGQALLERATEETGLRAILNRPIQWLHQLYFGSSPAAYSAAGPLTETPSPPRPVQSMLPGPNGSFVISTTGPGQFEMRHWQFIEIGASIGMILIVLMGGLLAVYFYRTQQRAESTNA
jgi:hypothetical protein